MALSHLRHYKDTMLSGCYPIVNREMSFVPASQFHVYLLWFNQGQMFSEEDFQKT